MTPRAELVHWLFAAGFLLLGLILLAEAIVGSEIFAMRRWRLYLWPAIAFAIGVLLWPVSVFYTNSTLHMLAQLSSGSQVLLTPLGRLLGEPEFGPLTRALISVGEGGAFAFGVAAGLTRRS